MLIATSCDHHGDLIPMSDAELLLVRKSFQVVLAFFNWTVLIIEYLAFLIDDCTDLLWVCMVKTRATLNLGMNRNGAKRNCIHVDCSC